MNIPIKNLKQHPKNEYFFDNVTGEKWNEFKESIKRNGIREPILITQDNMIVSGHQRYRAAKELGMDEVPCRTEQYASEDEILRDLIELNIRQRGVMADSEVKAGRRFEELKRIYGAVLGSNQYNRVEQIVQPKTSKQLADEYGITQQQINRAIQTSHADPVLQQMNIDGKISGDTIRYMMSQMSYEDRIDFLEKNEDVARIRKVDAQKFKAEKKKLEEELMEANGQLADYCDIENNVDDLKAQLAEKDKHIKQLEHDSETINSAAYFERSDKSVYNFEGIQVMHDFVKRIEDMLEKELAPAKYREYFDDIYISDVIMDKLDDAVSRVEKWCVDMRKDMNKGQKTNHKTATIIEM